MLDGVREAGNRWVFRDLGLEPHTVRMLLVGAPEADHGVDVTEHFELGVESLRGHAAYLRGLGDDAPEPREMLESFARSIGEQLGVRYAVAFEVITL